MPDIAMCDGNGCKRKFTCYRYRAKPNPDWQSWSSFDYKPDECENYIEIRRKVKVRVSDANN